MPEKNPLTELMELPLPSKNKQRKGLYQPTKTEVFEVYDLLNQYIFDGILVRPSINLRTLKYWGLCTGFTVKDQGRHVAKIKLYHRYPCKQWMIVILAHEMVHQYQWEILSPPRIAEGKKPLLSHGPSFLAFRPKLAEYGIPLKVSHCAVAWMVHQTIMKI